jgi:Mrp family chromosome partitioning ATPase
MRNEMKHTPPSLLERAAELYDFGAVLRAPAPVAAPAPPAARAPAPAPKPEPAPAPVPAAPEPAPVLRMVRPPEPPIAPPAAPRVAPLARQSGRVAEIDRRTLAKAGFIVAEGPARGIAEEFRLIKHELLADIEKRAALSEERRRSVLICSAQPRAGKTFCAINLALSLAGERDVEVLLADADFPKPDLLATLGIADDGPGLVDILADPGSDPEDFVIRTDVEGLSVLPAGRKTNNVPELLASDRTREVLAKLVAGDRRRIILFDSPPALMASHATVLAGHVGQALVVVRADQTTEADLRETIGLLHGCGHVGLILNGAGLAVTGRKFGAYDGYGHDQ